MKPRFIKLNAHVKKRLKVYLTGSSNDGYHRVARRIQAVLLSDEGKTSGEIAQRLKTSRSKVSEWLKNYQIHGLEALWEGHKLGRPIKLTKSDEMSLEFIISNRTWSGSSIKKFIADEFGVKYSLRHACNILIRYQRSYLESDYKKRWRRYAYTNIRNKPFKKGSP